MHAYLEHLSNEMARYAETFAYDDFAYLILALRALPDFERLRQTSYLDIRSVDEWRGGDCTQLSLHFATRVLDPLGIPWRWVVSTDASYAHSPRANLIPFRSTAVVADLPQTAGSYYIGVALGHLRPLRINQGEVESFWRKRYRIEVLSDARFRIHTETKTLTRYREYHYPSGIDFESAWRSLVHVKDHYGLNVSRGVQRHYLGYDLNQDRIFFTFRTSRVRSLPFDHFYDFYLQNMAQIEDQFQRETLSTALHLLNSHRYALRTAIIPL